VSTKRETRGLAVLKIHLPGPVVYRGGKTPKSPRTSNREGEKEGIIYGNDSRKKKGTSRTEETRQSETGGGKGGGGEKTESKEADSTGPLRNCYIMSNEAQFEIDDVRHNL